MSCPSTPVPASDLLLDRSLSSIILDSLSPTATRVINFLNDCPEAVLDSGRALLSRIEASMSILTGAAAEDAEDAEDSFTPARFTVPATAKEVLTSPQRDAWLADDEKALQSILAFPGNRLVPTSVPRAPPSSPPITWPTCALDPYAPPQAAPATLCVATTPSFRGWRPTRFRDKKKCGLLISG